MATAEIKAIITAEDKASSTLNKFGSSVSGLAHTAGVAAAALTAMAYTAATAFAVMGVKTAAQLETSRAGFITLLGSAEKADATLARIKQEASRTPFEIVGLTQATQLLSSITKDGDKAIDIILDVGESLAAMGKGQAELDRISINLQQIAAVGKASMMDVRQFAFAGIPIFEMLQQETGLAGEALSDFISGGGVTFDLLTRMFDKATSEGGRFFGAFKNQAGTFDQLWSNLKDTFSVTAAEIVTSTGLFGALKVGMEGISNWVVANKEEISTVFKVMFEGLKWAYDNVILPVFNYFQDRAPAILGALTTAWEFLKPAFEGLWTIIKTHLWPALQDLWKAIEPLAPYILGALVVAVYMLVYALTVATVILTGVVKAVTFVINAFNWLMGMANALGNAIGTTFAHMVTSALIWYVQNKAFVDGVINAFRGFIGFLGAWGGAVFQGLIWPFVTAFNVISSIVNSIKSNIGSIGNIARIIAPIPGFATGVENFGGGLAIVGEQGPELVNLPRGSDVIPNNQIVSGGGGSTTININVGLMTGSAIERREAAMKMFEDLQDIASQRGQTVGQLIGA